MGLRYGLDFGTSNSAIALYQNGSVHLLPIDATTNSAVIPTLLYVLADLSMVIGFEAIDQFVAHNVGREFKKKKVRIDSHNIESDAPTWAYIDVDMPGRFFQSLKTFLRDAYYEGTDVFGTYMSIEALVAAVLGEIKRRADEIVGQKVDAVTIGRPVLFSNDPAEDNLAKERLIRAAKLAGFTDVDLLYEPYAAALDYALTLTQPENVLVFDFGGGTLDFTIMHMTPRVGVDAFPKESVLATGGMTIGGNTFTEEIMANRVAQYFGADTTYSSGPTSKTLGLPVYIIEELRTWYTIPQLNERRLIGFLNDVRRLADVSKPIDNLLTLITKNYGWNLFQSIERTKRLLSTETKANISFTEGGIVISSPLSRRAFEMDIRSYMRDIDASLDTLLQQAGIEPQHVNSVITTGGTSLIPLVQTFLATKFPTSRIQQQAVFTSVVAGLSVAAARQSQ